jgi:hypothetical protein
LESIVSEKLNLGNDVSNLIIQNSMSKLKMICFNDHEEFQSLEDLTEKVVVNYELLQEENKLLL